jgi:NADH:ubiquinone oxidoreductase subunit K
MKLSNGFDIEIFLTGILGLFLARRNVIALLIAIEIMLLSSCANFICISSLLDDVMGLVFATIILCVAAVEASIGLAILIVYYRLRGLISTSFINALKG